MKVTSWNGKSCRAQEYTLLKGAALTVYIGERSVLLVLIDALQQNHLAGLCHGGRVIGTIKSWSDQK